ncbi:hypothetical protein N7478_009485 [Penicillium angulare]|uniref:uncharacterized protein n=1 Tax=Penicillium angulare TaxID=116970 RepID=UPI002540E8E8|nr:uncharacterized protein N7478_009485 [Penicillium angulare]KAJ5266677.1 hypothetical protein N7478_009485 [Penicillium angulare]
MSSLNAMVESARVGVVAGIRAKMKIKAPLFTDNGRAADSCVGQNIICASLYCHKVATEH